MQIIPIRDLKDTAKVSVACNQSNEPIFVTKNGYGDMVIMSMSVYQRQQEELLVLQRLLNAKHGDVVDGNDVNAKARTIYEV